MKTFFLLLFTFVLLSCNKRDAGGSNELSITLEPTFEQSAPNASSGKASATAFMASDQIGVYLILGGQELRAEGNVLDNHRFVVQSDGTTIKGDPSDAHYPDAKAVVEMFAYYPYDAGVSDAKKVLFSVQADQSTSAKLTQSDLCYAWGSVLPSSAAQKLQFAHRLSRAIFNVVTPGTATVSSIRMIDVATEVILDLSTGIAINTSTSGDVQSSAIEFVIPAQTIAAGRAMLEVTLSNAETYTYIPQADVEFQSGTESIFNLTLRANNSVELTNPPIVTPWTNGALSGEMTKGVENNFLVHWLLPHPAYKSVDNAKLVVYNILSGVSKDYDCAVTLQTDGGAAACSYSFDFEPAQSEQLGYPYRIDGVKFYNGATLVQNCTSLIAANIYKSGPYTLGIAQDNLLEVRVGSIVDWGDMNMNGDIEGGGVNNSFRVQMIDPWYAYTTITKIALTINGVKYNFDGLGLASGSNEFLATTDVFDFPDVSGLVPMSYPYNISRVDMYDAQGALVDGTVSNIDVGRGGLISLQFYRGGVIAIQSPLDAWGEENGSGVIIGTGTKNNFSLGLIDFQYSLDAIDAVRFESGGKSYTFKDVKAVLGSNQFFATTTVFKTPDSNGQFPPRYPFTISKVEVLDDAGLVLQSSSGSIVVYDTRDVVMQLYKNSLIYNTTSVGSWIDDGKTGDVSYGGALTANMISLYYSDIEATNLDPCTSVTKMVLTIGGRDVSLDVVLIGSGTNAVTTLPVSILTALPVGLRPSRYPYTISAIKLYNATNKLLINSTFVTPIVVLGSGAITLRVAR